LPVFGSRSRAIASNRSCGAGVLGTDMRFEFLVALRFVVRLHLLDGFANQGSCGVERPCASRARPALKILSFHPYEFPACRIHPQHLFDVTARAKAARFHWPKRRLVMSTHLNAQQNRSACARLED